MLIFFELSGKYNRFYNKIANIVVKKCKKRFLQQEY